MQALIMKRRFLVLWCALFGLMLWPSLWNRGAFLFADTTTYIRGADAAAYKITGRTGPWTGELLKRYPGASKPQSTASTNGANKSPEDNVVLSGRSLYYGIPLYLSDLAGSFWFLIFVQTALTTTALCLVVKRVSSASTNRQWLILLLPLLTPVGFFTAMMMPDFMAPLVIIATAMLFIYGREAAKAENAFWGLVVVYGLVAHSANVLIVAGLLACASVLRVSLYRSGRILPIFLALLAGILGELAASESIRLAAGQPPVRPPFLVARLQADGIGADYLKTRCAEEARFHLCKYVDRLPVDSDVFLWSRDRSGVFSAVPPSEQRTLAAEQSRLVLAILLDRPGAVLVSAAHNFLNQSSRTHLVDFNGPALDPSKLPDHARHDFSKSRAANSMMNISVLEALTPSLILTALFAIALLLWRNWKDGHAKEQRCLVTLLLAGVLINAAVCGILSKPHDRYQARLLWLIPFAAITLATATRRQTAVRNGLPLG